MTGARRSNRPPSLDVPTVWTSEEPAISLAWITRARVGDSVSGDTVVVRPWGTGSLIAVIDALGHGPNAAKVAKVATDWLDVAESGTNVTDAVHGLHKALAGTRGAAGLLFFVAAAGIEVCSVGNVELRSQSKLPFVLTPGVLGVRLNRPKTSTLAAPMVERFVLFSDGISGRFDMKAHVKASPSELASHIFANHRHTHDDSTVLVVDVKV